MIDTFSYLCCTSVCNKKQLTEPTLLIFQQSFPSQEIAIMNTTNIFNYSLAREEILWHDFYMTYDLTILQTFLDSGTWSSFILSSLLVNKLLKIDSKRSK